MLAAACVLVCPVKMPSSNGSVTERVCAACFANSSSCCSTTGRKRVDGQSALTYFYCTSCYSVYPGVTSPISVEPPSERHKQITVSLMAQLKAMNQFESQEEARQR